MRTIAYTALHYGADYLGYAIRSVIDAVDAFYILYSSEGSHGHKTSEQCPDRMIDLYNIASGAAGDKLLWFNGVWAYEGQQRDDIHRLDPAADVVLVVDADEIWPADAVKAALAPSPYRNHRMPMVHFWRSFYRAVLHDPAFPTRVIRPKGEGDTTLQAPPICHMGYAQRSELVRYKQAVHGHKNEWRRDCDWYQERFAANAQQDCHPVGSEYWNPEKVNPLHFMPDFMAEHPYAALDVIP